MMKLAITTNGWLDEQLLFAQQLGAEQIIARFSPLEPAQENGANPVLASLRNRVEKAGFELLGLDCSLVSLGNAIEGKAGRDQEIEFFRELIDHAGAAGIRLITYRWEDPLQRWEHLSYFLEGVIPAAEKEDMRLAGRLEPAPLVGKWARHAHEQQRSCLQESHNGLDFAPLSAGQQDSGSALLEKLLQPGLRERLFLITLDRALPAVPLHHLAAGNHAGLVDLFPVMASLHQAGCTASVRANCQNEAPGDADYQELAYACGYLRALLQTINHPGKSMDAVG